MTSSGFDVAAPFGLRDDVFMLLLSLPVIFYSAWIFFDGAVRALRARTLDMMVLVAVAVGAGWLYSLGVTLTGGGEVFYEAATVLSAFVLLGHWFEMRARGGANEAIRTLLDLAPPMATVIRDGEPVEDPDRRGRGRRPAAGPSGLQDRRRRRRRGRRQRPRRVDGHRREPPGAQGQPVTRVIGATLNTTGTLRVRATKVGADTALAQIVKLVQEAQNSKAPGQRLADRAAFWLVFVALIGGIAHLPGRGACSPVGRRRRRSCSRSPSWSSPAPTRSAWPRRRRSWSGPVSGAKRGVLFKNAMALETAAHIDTVVMDKTGTLTKGEPEVTDVIVDGDRRDRLLALVAAVERESEHPLAQAIVTEAERRERARSCGPSPSRACPATVRSPRSTATGSWSATAV